MSSESPFLVEYARSENSKCKSCGQKIPVNELRIARRFQSGRFDGLQVNWFHAHCFFDQHRPLSEGDFDGFENIRNLHQEYIRMEIGTQQRLYVLFARLLIIYGFLENSTNLVEYVAKKSKSESTLLEAVMSKSALRDYSLEYAKSGRAKCRHCMMPIEKVMRSATFLFKRLISKIAFMIDHRAICVRKKPSTIRTLAWSLAESHCGIISYVSWRNATNWVGSAAANSCRATRKSAKQTKPLSMRCWGEKTGLICLTI